VKTFHCDGCGSLVFFENVKCIKCGHALGFLPTSTEIVALEPAANGTWRALASDQKEQHCRLCENGRQHEVCNWLVAADDANPFCAACRLNELIPDLSVSGNQERWHQLEKAKHRIVYTIMRLGLPMDGVLAENRPALRFKFAGDSVGASLLTGHADGLITINIAEADDAEREKRRVNLHEPYRTLLGHLRHEVAHYYWDRLIARSPWLEGFRKLFGDENADYAAALQQYYANGAPPDWRERHVSAYASAHPWEDWAETWAHYFHIMDMVETAESFGMSLRPNHPAAPSMTAHPRNAFDVNMTFDAVLENWFPLTYALNSLNRGMGLLDAYPFVLSTRAIEKLRFIHDVAQSNRRQI
jgi:hypothetical protein